MTPSQKRNLELFRRLSEDDQAAVVTAIVVAMKWRGWDEMGGILPRGEHARLAIQKIAEIYTANKMDVEEYT